MYGGMSLIVAKEVSGDKIKNKSTDKASLNKGKNNASNQYQRTESTDLFHPLYGLRSMEANIFKGRPPRKGEDGSGEDNGHLKILEQARNMSKKTNVIDKAKEAELKREEEEKKKEKESKEKALAIEAAEYDVA
jgi:hypothetical protein